MTPFVETLHRWLIGGVGGGIEWSDGKKRRLAFIEGDELLLVQSNLKSEAMSRLVEDGIVADLEGATRRLRLSALLRATDGEIAAHPAIVPAAREPIPVALALWEVAEALPALPDDSWPRSVPDGFVRLRGLPWTAALVNYIGDLDGTRAVEDVTDFGPEAAEVVARALSVAWVVGALELGADASVAFQVTGTRKASSTQGSGLFEAVPAVPAPSPAPGVRSAWPDADDNTDEVSSRVESAQNHFDALGVAWQDSPESIRKAYMALAARFHPDRYATASEAERKVAETRFDRVREAWEVLSEQGRREAYTRKAIFGEQTEDEKAVARMQAIFEAERLLTNAQRDMASQRFSPALDTLTVALAADPDHPQIRAYHAYCVVRIHAGKPAADEASALIDTIVRDIPGADWARVLQGRARLAKGAIAEAQRSFVEALRLNPSNQDALVEMRRLKAPKAERTDDGFFGRFFKPK